MENINKELSTILRRVILFDENDKLETELIEEIKEFFKKSVPAETLVSQLSEPMSGQWIDVNELLPQYKDSGKADYSENVFTTDGKDVFIMARCYVETGWLWGNCYGDIDGDPEVDDQYENIIKWMPLPKP